MQLELKIRDLLNKIADPGIVAIELLKWWEGNDLSEEEKRGVACYAINAGSIGPLLELYSKKLMAKETIPWGPFVEALGRASYRPQKPEILALITGSQAQELLPDLTTSFALDTFSSLFIENRRTKFRRERQRILDLRQQLLEKLEFVRSQRIPTEEKKVLHQLGTLFPGDQKVQSEAQVHAEQWAREIINQREAFTDLDTALEDALPPMSTEVVSAKDHLFNQVMKYIKKHPDQAFDYALMFESLEFYKEAYEVLCHAPSTKQADWLKLEILIKGRQFVSALEETNGLELKYAGDPNSTFAVIYARAQALWGLGQKDTAIDLMKSIVNLRPSYRSARAILSSWSEGSYD